MLINTPLCYQIIIFQSGFIYFSLLILIGPHFPGDRHPYHPDGTGFSSSGLNRMELRQQKKLQSSPSNK